MKLTQDSHYYFISTRSMKRAAAGPEIKKPFGGWARGGGAKGGLFRVGW
jgi:hypothetical protein